MALKWTRQDGALVAEGSQQTYRIAGTARGGRTLYTKGHTGLIPRYLRRSHIGTIAECKARAEHLETLKPTRHGITYRALARPGLSLSPLGLKAELTREAS